MAKLQLHRGFARQAVLWIILALLGGGVGYVIYWRSTVEQSTAARMQAPQQVPTVTADASAPESSAPTLSERAAEALRDGRFVLPAGDSALDYYAELLSTDTANLDLQQALTDTLGLGAGQFDSALNNGDLATAEDVYQRIRAARPDYLLLPALRERLDAAQAQPASDAAADPLAISAAPPPETPVAASGPGVAVEPAVTAAAEPQPERAIVAPQPTAAEPPRVETVVAEPQAPDVPPASEPAPVEIAAVSETTAEPAAPVPAATVATPAPAAAVARSEPELRQITPLQPNYPRQAMQRRLEGQVTVRFVVRADGRVADVDVASSNPPGVFDMEAVRAIQRVRFEPPGRDVNATRSIEFRLPRS